jgi:hypothetical protein
MLGMCRYLPFRKGMSEGMEEEEDKSGDHANLFECSDGAPSAPKTRMKRAVEFLREELAIPVSVQAMRPPCMCF